MENRCQAPVPVVRGHTGRVVTGQIIPALEDVRVVMEVIEDGVTSMLEALSDEKGFYVFSSIEPSASFISFARGEWGLNDTRWRRCARVTCSTSRRTV